jgi:hypothetical protein
MKAYLTRNVYSKENGFSLISYKGFRETGKFYPVASENWAPPGIK